MSEKPTKGPIDEEQYKRDCFLEEMQYFDDDLKNEKNGLFIDGLSVYQRALLDQLENIPKFIKNQIPILLIADLKEIHNLIHKEIHNRGRIF